MTVQHDGSLAISIGRSRFETAWSNMEMTWGDLVNRLSVSKDTGETMAAFLSMSKDQQDNIKDIGGFVGGHLSGGVRRTGHVDCRQILTLDLDTPPEGLWDELMDNLALDFAMLVYSTHKHGPGSPRYRLIIPLSRRVSADEYEAIARKIAEKVGIDYCDDSTFQATRLMYWPSHPTDAAPFFEFLDAEWLNPDDVLAEYGGHWQDTSYWPQSSRQPGLRKAAAAKQGDPTAKTGIVGAFCRTYDVPAAIAKFLPGVYVSTGKDDRMTYSRGSSSGGLVIYDDGRFAYSNHATDPAGGVLCNAFDLVRLHLYGEKDDPAAGLSGGQTESFKAMAELASQDAEVKATLAEDAKAAANAARAAANSTGAASSGGGNGGDDEPPVMLKTWPKDQLTWEEQLDRKPNGELKPTIQNCMLILSAHPGLKAIKYNELARAIEVDGELPWSRPDKYWREADEAQLYAWVSCEYNVKFSDSIFNKALAVVADERRFSPLKDYINKLPAWDGIERVNTLFTDYLGAEASDYVAAVTRASMIGAIKRALVPGCKHDTVLVLDGPKGIGKSTLLAILGGEFFSDSLSMTDTRDKTGAEKLQGVWIMEIGEMQGTRKADVDNIKGFLSRQIDEYRPAYGRVVERRPRTAVIWGTTNSQDGFLRDTTGNRRFWPVHVSKRGAKSVWDDLPQERDQLWAEALAAYKAGEPNYLDAKMEEEAERAQQAAMEMDDREGLVLDYLDTPVPADFYAWDANKRAGYFLTPGQYAAEHKAADKVREFVSPVEIWVECFGKPLNRWERKNAYEIAAIMARLPGWSKCGQRQRIDGYGMQRVYSRI